MEELKSESSSKKKQKQRWEKSTTDANGLRKSVSVEEVENGFIISMDKYGDVDGKYISECKKFISKENPLAAEKPKEEKSEEDNILDALENLNF